MSNSLTDLAAYPQLVPSQNQIALGQALMNAGAAGPTPAASASALSPAASAVQGILGSLLMGQGQQGVQQYATQQQQALADALRQQNSILTGDSSPGLPSGGGLQGANPGTLSNNGRAANAPPSPTPVHPIAAATPNGTGGYHIPGASPYSVAIMNAESGGNANATSSTSSAAGPAQFTDGTWNGFVQANPGLFHGLSPADIASKRADPIYAAEATDWLAGENSSVLQQGGVAPSGPNLALAHFLGPVGAAAVIRAQPGTPVMTALGGGLPARATASFAKANPQLASMTVDQLRNRYAGIPNYQVASADTGTATDALPSPNAPPPTTGAIVGGANRAGAGLPTANSTTAALLNNNAPPPVLTPQNQALVAQLSNNGQGSTASPAPPDMMSKGMSLYTQGQQYLLSPNPRLQSFGQSEMELGRTYLQRGQFQTVTLPNGVQAQRNAVTGEIQPLPQRPVVTADGTVYDANSGQPIAGGVGAGGVRPQTVQGAALNTIAALAPLVRSGQATPQQQATYAAAASAYRGQPQTVTNADGTTSTFLNPLPTGFPDPLAPGGVAGGPGAAGGAAGAPGTAPSVSSGMPVSGGVLPGPTRAATALPQSQGQATGTALADSVGTIRTAGQTGQRVVDQVSQIKQSLAGMAQSGLPSGYFSPEIGEAAAAAKYLGFNLPGLTPGAVTNQQEAEATLKQFGGAVLKSMFPSRITNGDISIFLPSMGDLSHDPQAVGKILDNAEAYANYDVAKSQSMERALSANGGQLPPTWQSNYNLIHGSSARLAPVPSSAQASTLGWGSNVPADVSNLNGFGRAPQHGVPPIGTVATGANGAQQVMTTLGWKPYASGQGVMD